MNLEDYIATFITQFEGYTATAKWDVNAWRIGHGSDTLELPGGGYRKVLQTDVTTRELAAKDLARRIKTEFIPRVRDQIGAEYFDKLPAGAKIALVSLAYNYGSITKPAIVNAARQGNMPALSQAIVVSTQNDNQKLSDSMRQALRNRRIKEATLVMSGANIDDSKTGGLTKGSKVLIITLVVLLILFAIFLIIYRKKIAGFFAKK